MTGESAVITQYEDRFPATEIRPGVQFPDWTTVSSDTAAEALLAILSVLNAADRWSEIGAMEDQVRQAVLH